MKSAKDRNRDFYNKNKPYLKIQIGLKENGIVKSLTEIKTLTKDQITNLLKENNLSLDLLNEIPFVKDNNSLSDQTDSKNDLSKNISKEILDNTTNENENENRSVSGIDQSILGNKFSGIDVVYPNWKNKLQENIIPYMERNGEIDLIIEQGLGSDKILNICGESGIGKTLLCKTIAQKLKSPLVFVGCHDNLTSDDLEGSIQLLPNDQTKEVQTKYVLGGIAQAIHCANNSETKLCVLVFDEINTLLPNVQKILNNRTNFKEGIEINSIGLKLKLNDGCQILCLATQNPAHYNGTYPLNTELLSKIEALALDDLDDKRIIQLLKDTYDDLLSPDLIEQIIEFKNTMVNNHVNGKLDKGIDTREVIAFCNSYKRAINNKRKEDQALKIACHMNFYAKYSTMGKPDQEKISKETIESCFGITDLKLV
ncbi:MAG: AAA domain-containing protein [Nitrosopumilaceae archaeon]|nr:AAA domain-containing protein [Nitrosopumilaceae archaeon]